MAIVHRTEHIAGASAILVHMHTTALADDDGNERAVDSRVQFSTYVNRTPAARVRSASAGTPGNIVLRLWPDAYDGASEYYYHHREPYVLFPGTGLTFSGSANNTQLASSFWWIERSFDREELRGVRPDLFS